MKRSWIVHEGVRWFRAEGVAEIYSLHTSYVRALCAEGLLAESRTIEGELWLAEAMLDRLAQIHRLHHHLGVDLDLVSSWIDREGDLSRPRP
jgi:hypothetical protein